jgi:hypothetical protein
VAFVAPLVWGRLFKGKPLLDLPAQDEPAR